MVESPELDRAVEEELHDKLVRGPFVESIVSALVRETADASGAVICRRSRGFVVGLTGPWGSGKSSILNLLARRLGSMDRVLVAKLNPWLFNSRDEILNAFFASLRETFGRSGLDDARQLVKALGRYRKAINAGTDVAVGAADAAGGVGMVAIGRRLFSGALVGLNRKRTITEERAALEKRIEKTDAAVVVLIDELDRLEDEEVRATAQLVKAVGDIKGISYLVAYDPLRVTEALSRPGSADLSSGERYLEKIIQHAIPIRPLVEDDIKALISDMLDAHGLALPEPADEQDHRILEHLLSEIRTPREVKRLIGAFAVSDGAVRGEINAYDVLAYCWILTKSPLAAAVLAEQPERVVDDPPKVDAFDQAWNDAQDVPTPVSVLGDAAAPQQRTFELLFPRFRKGVALHQGDRLSLWRNLMRLLYLGNPPGMFRRSDIEQIWTLTTIEEAASALDVELKAGRLATLVERLADLLPQLPEDGDRVFWPALSRVMQRPHDWNPGLPETDRNRVDDVTSTLAHFVQRDSRRRLRVQRIVHTLIQHGDLLIVPSVLRHHLFAFGLTQNSEERGGAWLYDKAQTEDLRQRELPRYTNAVADGTALRRLPDPELLFTLLTSGAFDLALRQAFTNQLNCAEAVETLAALLTPPGVRIEYSALDQMIDPESALGAITKHVPLPTDASADTWSLRCVRRLQSVLEGRRPE